MLREVCETSSVEGQLTPAVDVVASADVITVPQLASVVQRNDCREILRGSISGESSSNRLVFKPEDQQSSGLHDFIVDRAAYLEDVGHDAGSVASHVVVVTEEVEDVLDDNNADDAQVLGVDVENQGSGGSSILMSHAKNATGVCRVCGDDATGMYFGALVCVSCKTFFLRYEGNVVNFVCKSATKQCPVTVRSRTQCKFCRYQKCLQVGMYRRVRPAQVLATEGQQLCAVCGDIGNGVHFGAITCEGCKKFFRRGLSEKSSYICLNDTRCIINPRTRNGCRYCRYNKCLSIGMSRTAIQMGRPSKMNENGSTTSTSPTVTKRASFLPHSSTVTQHQLETATISSPDSLNLLSAAANLMVQQSFKDVRNHVDQSDAQVLDLSNNGATSGCYESHNTFRIRLAQHARITSNIVKLPDSRVVDNEQVVRDAVQPDSTICVPEPSNIGDSGDVCANATHLKFNQLSKWLAQAQNVSTARADNFVEEKLRRQLKRPSSSTFHVQVTDDSLLTCGQVRVIEPTDSSSFILQKRQLTDTQFFTDNLLKKYDSAAIRFSESARQGFVKNKTSEQDSLMPSIEVLQTSQIVESSLSRSLYNLNSIENRINSESPVPRVNSCSPSGILSVAQTTDNNDECRKVSASNVAKQTVTTNLISTTKQSALAVDVEQLLAVSKKYWLEPRLPNDNSLIAERHWDVINHIIPAYDRFVVAGTSINRALKSEFEMWTRQTAKATSDHCLLSHWIQSKVIPAYTNASVAYCKDLIGFSDFDPDDQIKIIRLGQSPSRILVAALHWYDADHHTFRNFLSWRDGVPGGKVDLFKKKLINYSEELAVLELDSIEAALLNVLIIIATDYPSLKNENIIEETRQRIIATLKAYTISKFGMSSNRLAVLFSQVPEVRRLGLLHHQMTKTRTMTAEEVENIAV